MSSVVLVKLGGSLITRKEMPDTPRLDLIGRLAGELAEAWVALRGRVVLGHGSGSFGHTAAQGYGLAGAAGSEPASAEVAQGASDTQAKAAELNAILMEALREAGLPAFSIAPSAASVGTAARIHSFQAEPFALALSRSLLPVTFGDVVLDREWGASILSTETVLFHLATKLPEYGWTVERALWLGETDGVLDAAGKPIARISPDSADALRATVRGSDATDVTGGMAHRLDTALAFAERGIRSWIGDGSAAGALTRALCEEKVGGTWVVPDAA